MATLRHIVLLVVAACLALPPGGCDKHAQDKREIRDVWDSYKNGNIEHHGEAVARLMSQKTVDHYTALVKKGMDLPAKEVWELPPSQMAEILRMRVRSKRSELKGMDGRAYVAFATGKGWYEEDDDTWKLTDIHVADGRAQASVYNPEWETEYAKDQTARVLSRRTGQSVDKPFRYSVEFTREGDAWKLDETSIHEWMDKEIREAAKRVKMSVRDLLMAVEADHAGEEKLPFSVWDPMKK